MTNRSIISDREALQILKNDLRKLALRKHVAELNEASQARRSEILGQVERDIRKELRKRAMRIRLDVVLH